MTSGRTSLLLDEKSKAIKRHLDFIVIGAQKSGTTSLFKYLQKHPDIFVPAAKEAPFFSEQTYHNCGFDWYLARFFRNADPQHLWGTITPSYMANLDAAERIHQTIPEVKLIALLRNPVDRAISQYRMACRRGVEGRPIADAFEELLRPENVAAARDVRGFTNATERDCYLAWGEYGRIIRHYRMYFPKDRIHISFFDDLEACPGKMLDGLLHFLGLETGYRPSNLGQHYFRGGTRNRIPRLAEFVAPPLRLMPQRFRSALLFNLEVLNTMPSSVEIEIQPSLRSKLQQFYHSDVRLLEEISGTNVPWEEFR